MSANVRPQLIDMRNIPTAAQKKPSKKGPASSGKKRAGPGPQLVDIDNGYILDRIAALEEELAALKALLNR